MELSRRRLALLAIVAASSGRGVSRERLITCLWPDAPNTGKHPLEQLLSTLRGRLGQDAFCGVDPIELNPAVITSDIDAFSQALDQGDPARAVALYGGPFLDGFYLDGLKEFEEWAETKRASYAGRYIDSLTELAIAAQNQRDLGSAVTRWRQLVLADPLRTHGTLGLMKALALAGDRAGAIQHARIHEDLLSQELDLPVDPAITALKDHLQAAVAGPAVSQTEAPGAVVQTAFPAEDEAVPVLSDAVLGAHATSPAEPVTKHRGSIPPPFEALRTSSGGTIPTDTRPVRAVAPAQRSHRRLWLGLGVAALVFAGMAAGLFARGAKKTPAHNRVVVLPFENRTGDAAWDHLSLLAGDYIAQSLLQTGMLQVVPMSAAGQVTGVLRAQQVAGGTALPQRVARETGAGWALSGAYYLAGDSLRFVVELTDAVGEKLLALPEPVLAGTKDPMPGLERLRRLIAGTLAHHVDPRWRRLASVSQAPASYETLKLMQEALNAFWRDFREALRLYQQAFALDSTYEPARLWMAVTYANLGEWDAADSVFRLSEQNQKRLGPVDKLLLGWFRAELNGDRQAASRIIKATTELTPSLGYATLLGFEALKLNRAHEALKILDKVDPASPQMGGRWQYWGHVTDAHHMLGEHDWELTASRRARKQYPDLLRTLWFEAQALAALGRVDEVSRLLDQAGNFTPGSASINDPGLTAGLLAIWSGLELLAHGDSTAAENAFARSVSWYQSLPEQQRNGQQMQYGEALYYSRAFTKAEEVFDRACSMTPDTPDCLGWAGVVKARLGQRDQALALREAIYRTDSTPRVRIQGQAYNQARISAAVGDREGAVEFLRRSFAHGDSRLSSHHRVYDFHDLLNYPPFKELIKPKD